MWYLFVQIWLWLLLAFILGWLAHWFFCCRAKTDDTVAFNESTTSIPEAKPIVSNIVEPAATEKPDVETVQDDWKPQGFASIPADADDLKRIKGIGSVIEKTLNELGIYQFKQISQWSNENVQWVESFIAFPGRIDRENWIEQSRTLSAGGTTEFAKRVDKGDLDY